MKTIALFVSAPIDKVKRDSLSLFLTEIGNRVSVVPYGICETNDDRKCIDSLGNFHSSFALQDLVARCVATGLDNTKYLPDKYQKYNLQRVRLKTSVRGANLFSGSATNFNSLICLYIKCFEILFEENKIDCVCFGLDGACNNRLIPILEAVCREFAIDTVYLTNPLHRFVIYDNLARVSEKIEEVYLDKIENGLSHAEIQRLVNAITAYIEFKRTDMWLGQVSGTSKIGGNETKYFHNKLRLPSMRPSYQAIKLLAFQLYRICSDRNNIERRLWSKRIANGMISNDEKYILLLPNKALNYRTNFIAPFYSDLRTIIRNISLSLPFTHSLLVRNHPGTRGYDVSCLEEVHALENVAFVDSEMDLFDLINQADAVCTIAGSVSLDALLCYKHLITFGNQPYLFGDTQAPVFRVTDWEELPTVIQSCIHNEPDKEQILAYLYAFIKASVGMTVSLEHTDWLDEDCDPSKNQPWFKLEEWQNIGARYLARHLEQMYA